MLLGGALTCDSIRFPVKQEKQVVQPDALVFAIPPLWHSQPCRLQSSMLGVNSLVQRTVGFLSARDLFARASPCIRLPQDRSEGCLANFGGSRAAGALGLTLLAAELCFATWSFSSSSIHSCRASRGRIIVFFATSTARLAIIIPGRQADCFAGPTLPLRWYDFTSRRL